MECKYCEREFSRGVINAEFGLCPACMMIVESKIAYVQDMIGKVQPLANAAEAPDDKIGYLKLMLEALYEYKIQVADKGIDVLGQDIEELIDTVIDAISEARV